LPDEMAWQVLTVEYNIMAETRANTTTFVPLDVSCIDNESGFQALAKDWNHLAELTLSDSVFLRHEWFDAAWKWLKQDSKMAILCVRRHQSLLGICPLILRNTKDSGIRIRSLEFMSVPDTQYCDILADPCERSEVISALTQYLCSSHMKWDRLLLSKLGADSDIASIFPKYVKQSTLAVRVQDDGTNPGIPLDCTWEEFYSRRSRRLKKGNNHASNRLHKSGRLVELTHVDASSKCWENVSQILDIAIGISSRSWKNKTGLTLENPGPSAFIRRLTEHAHRFGWLSLWLLEFDGVPVAIEYQLVYDGIVTALRADYDPAFEELSPGTYLNWKMLEQLFGKSYQYYSMGPGENAYKLRWAEEYPKQYRITLYNKTVRGRMLGAVNLKLHPFAKSIICKLKSGGK